MPTRSSQGPPRGGRDTGPSFLESFLEYVHSFRYWVLRPAFIGLVFPLGSSGALGLALPPLSVEAFTVCSSYSPSSPSLGEYLAAFGAEIAIWSGVVARASWSVTMCMHESWTLGVTDISDTLV